MKEHELVTFVKDILIPLVKQPLPLNFTRVSLQDLLYLEDILFLLERAEQCHGVRFDDSYIERFLDLDREISKEISVSAVIDELKKKIERKS